MGFPYHRIIRASAGSGKTYALTTRYLGLILSGESPDSILAVTFTRTAAGEIMERILERLLSALEPNQIEDLKEALSSEGFTQLATELGSVSPDEAVRRWIEPALTRLLSLLHKCQVSTLDAFFAKIATGFTYECDLAPGWQILDEEVLARIRSGAIQKILEEEESSDARQLMHRLNKGSLGSQVAADLERLVTRFHEKWREFPPTAWDLPVKQEGPTQQALDRAWDELIKLECPKDASGKKKLVKWEEALQDIQDVWSEDLQARIEACNKGLLAKALKREYEFYRKPFPEELIEILNVFLKQVKSDYCDLIRIQNQSTGSFLQRFDGYRTQGLKDQGGLNYNDVPVALLQARVLGQMGLVDNRMDASVRHLLLDEFQDTSFIQFAVLDPLIDELSADSAGGRSLFCVGDSKQAIYGWRGGRAEVMELFQQKLKPDSEVRLDASWRSSEPVIETVNRTFGDLSQRAPKPGDQSTVDHWSSLFDEHRVADRLGSKPEGHVTLRIAQEYEGKSSKIWPYLETLEEVERLQKSSPGCTIAILVRKNAQISHLVEALKSKGIEASEERGNPLTDSPAVGRILALLELIEHPDDSTMKLAVERSPIPQILGKADDKDWDDVSSELRQQIFSQGLAEVLGPICDEFSKLCSPEDQLRIRQLMEQVRSLGFHGLRLGDLIQGLRQRSVPRPGGSPVQVMTIHQAKGLEFDAVILPELNFQLFTPVPDLLTLEEDSRPVHLSRYIGEKQQELVGDPFPQMLQQSRDQRFNEALCLLYVAMTRAKNTLTMLLSPPPKSGNYSANTYASLLVSQLAPNAEIANGATLFECGLPGDLGPATKSEKRKRRKVGKRRPQANPTREETARASHKATNLNQTRRRALHLGSLIHHLLEQSHWQASSPAIALELLHSDFPREKSLHQEAVSIVCHAFDQSEFADLFDETATRKRLGCKKSDELTLEVEVPILTQVSDQKFHGVIDRMVLIKAGGKIISAELIDFKTDSAAKNASDLIESYREQMDRYRQAVHNGWGIPLKDLQVRLAHVNSGTVCDVEFLAESTS